MKKTLSLILISSILAIPLNNIKATVNDNTIKSIVQIKCITDEGSWQGSGVIISSDGYVITNKHVVSSDTTIYTGCSVGTTTSESSPAQFLYTADTIVAAAGVDLALLKIKSDKKDFNYTPVKLYTLPKSGTDIQALGYPGMGGANITYTRGYVSGVIGSQEDLGNFFIKADINIDAGNSGGGAFTNDNELLGITSAVLPGKYNVLGLIIPTVTIKDFLYVNSYKNLITQAQPKNNSQFLQFDDYIESKVSTPEIPPDGTLIKAPYKPGIYEYEPDYYLVDEGRKRPIYTYGRADTFNNCGFKLSDVKIVSKEVFDALPNGYDISKYAKGGRSCYTPLSEKSRRSFTDGTLVQLSFKYWPKQETNTIYLIENGKKRPFVSWDIFKNYGYDLWKWDDEGKMNYPSYHILNEAEFFQYPIGEAITNNNPPGYNLPEGALIRAAKGIDIYIVKYIGIKKFKRLVLSPSVFNNYGHLKWEDVIEVDNLTLNSFTTSELVRAVGDDKIYRLYPQGDTGQKRLIKNNSVLTRLGLDLDSIYEINSFDRESYITGLVLE